MRSIEAIEGDAWLFSTWDRKLAEKPVPSARVRREIRLGLAETAHGWSEFRFAHAGPGTVQ